MKDMPKYLSIAQDIIAQIEDGTLRSGEQLMTENLLCEKYKVSRMTVNKALATLVNKGYIVRTAGKGTFILDQKVTKYIGAKSSTSFSKDMQSIKTKPGAILVDYRVIRASEVPNVLKQLELEEEDFLHYIHRIRTSDGVHIALSHTYIPCKYLPALDVTVLEHSLYEYLDKEYHIHPQALDYTFSALLPTHRQRELLQVDSCALLKSCHRSIIESGVLFEYTETYYAGNRYTYKFTPEKLNLQTD